MSPAPNQKWSPARLDELCALRRSGLKTHEIAARMGASKGSVTGYLHRLRLAGDPRVPPSAPAGVPAVDLTGLDPIHALAEVMACGATFDVAARRLKMGRSTVLTRWSRICCGLGPQAS